jgi:hypothetical protein
MRFAFKFYEFSREEKRTYQDDVMNSIKEFENYYNCKKDVLVCELQKWWMRRGRFERRFFFLDHFIL